MRPGWRTTEFWLTLLVTLGGSLSAIYNDSDVVRTASALVAAASTAWYTSQRTALKTDVGKGGT